MSDPRADDRTERPTTDDPSRDVGAAPASEPPRTGGAESTSEPPPTGEPSEALQRRAFLRQLTGEAVVTTARIAGLSTAVRRSLFAAGEAATRELDPTNAELAPSPSGPPGPASPASPAGDAAQTVEPARVASTPARSSVALSPRQEAILTTARTAVLGTNDAAGAPHLTSSIFQWDGAIVRLPSELFAARVERIDADPRCSVLIADEGASDAWVAMTGTAEIVSGDGVHDQMLTILGKYMSEDDAARTWTELGARGDGVVIAFRPSRYVWRVD